MATVRQIQQALKAAGHDPGKIDGIWGRKSIAALRRYQTANGLAADGIIGPLTLASLFGGTPAETAPPPLWYAEAVRLLGLREGKGKINNPVILDMADDLGVAYASDDIAWCGLFLGHCIATTLPDEPLPSNPLGARSWLKFGKPCSPALGAILVFWREAPTSWKGHVGFYAGEDDDHYHVLGGNQGDSVSIIKLPRGKLLPKGMRQPATVPTLTGGPVRRKSAGGYSLKLH